MTRFPPGVYTIRNANSDWTGEFNLNVDNTEVYSMGGTLTTVNVREVMYCTIPANVIIRKVANDYFGIVGNTGESV